MQIPLDFWNISLWLSITAIILLITAQLVSAYKGPSKPAHRQKKTENCSISRGITLSDNCSHAHLRNGNIERTLLVDRRLDL